MGYQEYQPLLTTKKTLRWATVRPFFLPIFFETYEIDVSAYHYKLYSVSR